MDPDLAFAHRMADLADRIALERFRASDLVVETKPDLTPVTEADRAVERALRKLVAAERPGDQVVGEEFGAEPEAGHPGRARWVVDPIDGTKNFIRGIPIWATLLALERDGRLAVGVASAPALGRRWWAARGGGAFTGELADGGLRAVRPVRVSRISRIEEAQVCYGGLGAWRRAGRLEALLELARRSWRSRGYGDFWMHMLVAEGSAEVAAEFEVRVWDLAAVQVIVEEAGGAFTDLSGAPRPDGGSALSTNGLLHREALQILGRPLG